ncbi:tyrosine-protein phosphatase [Ferrimicrobium sp.]|uniref:tyrosine-protein phosphatase n=1 Tax=Ferrimicrobium sp. TaxID=2926050 RepID=UPI002631607D|nr:tyrosine-protein phosphatase [Ferrimicrobium sp.]
MTTDLPSQFLPWEGLYNLRDLGGYTTIDGRATRRGLLFRSEAFFRLSNRSRSQLFAKLHLRTVIDLRSDEERQQQGYVETTQGQRLLHLPLIDVSVASELDRTDRDYLAKVYRAILTSQSDSLRGAMSAIVNPDNWPLLFHCAAGKDRTGIVAMLTLAIAQVSDAQVATDYALTQYALRRVLAANDPEIDKASWKDLPPSVVASTPETALQTLSFLQHTYGSVADYLVALGLEPAQLAKFGETFTTPMD